MKKNQEGIASIEATISLTIFIFAILAIYSIINFCIVQEKMSYAVNTTAKELSQYTYFYDALGVDKLNNNESKQQVLNVFDTFTGAVGATEDAVDGASTIVQNMKDGNTGELSQTLTDIKNAQSSVGELTNTISSIGENPMGFVKSLAALAGSELLQEGLDNMAAALGKNMIKRHFGADPDQYLEDNGVVNGLDGLNFNLSTMFSSENPKDIQITVVYELKLAKILPFDFSITVCQSARTRGWFGDQ